MTNMAFHNPSRPFLILLFVMSTSQVLAGGPLTREKGLSKAELEALVGESGFAAQENERVISSTLAVLLGTFGAHRIYLGTTPRTAILYGVTFGGFGVMVLLDLGHLLFSKDLGPYRNNERFFMWGKPKEELIPQ